METLPEKHRELVTNIKNLILENQEGVELYLFGSYAKGRVRSTSDIDLLVLFKEMTSREELKKCRRQLTDIVEEEYEYKIEVDIKPYNKESFEVSSNRVGFENEISKYMIRLE